jgi:hypothetical protein
VAQQTQIPGQRDTAPTPSVQPRGRRARPGSGTGLILKILLLGLVLALAIFGAFPLVEQRQWLGLALLIGVTALLFWIYLSPRRIPAKYLIPGTLFLLAFQVFPVLYTMSTAVHELRGRPPGQQGGRDPGHRGRLDHQGARLGRLPALRRHRGRSRHR